MDHPSSLHQTTPIDILKAGDCFAASIWPEEADDAPSPHRRTRSAMRSRRVDGSSLQSGMVRWPKRAGASIDPVCGALCICCDWREHE